MPSPFLPILAQQAPDEGPPAPRVGTAEPAPAPPAGKDAGAPGRAPGGTAEFRLLDPPTVLYGHEYQQPPIVVIPVFLAILALVSVVVERISTFIVKRLASRTDSQVDDVFFDGIPRLVRAQLVFVGLHVVANALIHPPAIVTVSQTITALNYVVVGFIATGVSLRMIDAWVEHKPHIRAVGPGLKLAIKVLVIPFLLVVVLQAYGVDVGAFLTVLGVGSLAVALALQDVLKNIFAGIQLVLDQPMRAGDFVVLDDSKVRGTVLEVGLRSTKIRTVENNVVTVPNANVASAIITNTDVQDPTYTHVVKVGVSYGSDTRHVQAVLEDEAARAMREVPEFVEGSSTVVFAEMADFALVFRVVVRLKRFSGYFTPIGELQHRIFARLAKEGIEIPFPTRTVYVRQETPAAPAPPPAAT